MIRLLFPFLTAAGFTAACDMPGQGAAPGTDSAARPSAPESLPVDAVQADGSVRAAGYLAEPRFAQADMERGEVLSLSCVVCHTLGPGERHLLGPNLHGIFGRAAASAVGFNYSVALRAADIVWTPDRLDAWLAEPDGFAPGNRMVFAGLYSVSDRSDLLAYLLRETGADQVE